VLGCRKRQQFVVLPDAREGQRVAGNGPLLLEPVEAFGQDGPRPVVPDVEQVAALGALEEGVQDVEARAAIGVDALLVRDVGADANGRGPFPLTPVRCDVSIRRTPGERDRVW